MRRAPAVLDTGAGLNFTKGSEITKDMRHWIHIGQFLGIFDANNNPLSMRGTIKLPVRLFELLGVVEFIFFEIPAALFIIGEDYCDRLVDPIRPRLRKFHVNDWSHDRIARKTSMKTRYMFSFLLKRSKTRKTEYKTECVVHILSRLL